MPLTQQLPSLQILWDGTGLHLHMSIGKVIK
jgi:hypothetical protein